MAAPLRVLVVDESASNARLVMTGLRQRGFDVVETWVHSGAALSLALSSDSWDLVIASDRPADGGPQSTVPRGGTTPGPVTGRMLSSGNEGEERVHWTKSGRLDGRPAVDQHVRGPVVELDRRNAEEALQRTERYYRTLIERATDIIVLVDVDRAIRYVSPSGEAVLGYPAASLPGHDPLDLIHPSDQANVAKTFEAIARDSSRAYSFEARFRHANGSWRAIEGSGMNFLGDPAVAGVVVTLRDVTDRHRLEEHLRQSQRMETIGKVAGGVAHDFNNILTVILSFGALLRDEIGDQPNLREAVEMILAAGESASALTRQLLDFSRRQSQTVQDVDLNSIVEQLARMLRRLIGEDVDLTLKLSPDVGLIRGNVGYLEQILFNLSTNARDAMPAGGSLTIQTSAVQVASHEVADWPDASGTMRASFGERHRDRYRSGFTGPHF